MKINVEDVVKWFNDIATAAMQTGDFTNANRAMENLAKYLQMFTERREVTHRVVHSKEELDTRIAELSRVLKEVEPDIEARLRIN
jgi:acyl carrier protein phosphodiesterase